MDGQWLLDHWADAERTGDVEALLLMLDEDFRGIGPHGFVLDRTRWLERFQHPFDVTMLTIEQRSATDIDGVLIVIGSQTQAATYRGQSSNGEFTLTLVAHKADGRAVVDVAQLSGPLPVR